jgi:hypothetical protein
MVIVDPDIELEDVSTRKTRDKTVVVVDPETSLAADSEEDNTVIYWTWCSASL